MPDKQYDFTIVESWEEICSYQEQWDRLIDVRLKEHASNPIADIDGSQRFAWSKALAESRKIANKCNLIVISAGRSVEALLLVTPALHIERNAYSPVSDLYSGRTNLLVCATEPDSVLLQSVITAMNQVHPQWDVLSFFCCSSIFADHLRQTAEAVGLTTSIPQQKSTPFMSLPQSIDELVAARPKKFRYLLRNSRKQLSEHGELGFWHSGQEADMQKVIERILEIERCSWKEEAGTSITRNPEQEAFYRTFLPGTLTSGQTRAYFLTLEDRCIAYVLGLFDAPMFCDLKESYVSDLADFSPSHVLKLDVFQDLISNNVTCYDFMGECEPYKMKWGAEVYVQFRVELYNKRKFTNFVRSTRRTLLAKFGNTANGDV